MLQDIHLPDDSDNFYDDHVTNTLLQFNDNDIDAVLIESTSVETDCSDFGSHALHQEDVPVSDQYNAYNSIVPRAKELVSLVDASKIPKERGFLVEEALDKIIFTEKANIASEKPPPRGILVSGCRVGKVPSTTNALSWNFDNNYLVVKF
jgi:hypothetical protein